MSKENEIDYLKALDEARGVAWKLYMGEELDSIPAWLSEHKTEIILNRITYFNLYDLPWEIIGLTDFITDDRYIQGVSLSPSKDIGVQIKEIVLNHLRSHSEKLREYNWKNGEIQVEVLVSGIEDSFLFNYEIKELAK